MLAVVLYVRLRLLFLPLERDEGEFAYIGQLILKGIPPFTHAYSMKLPGVSLVYALFMALFGQTPAGIHSGLLIINLVSIFLLYLLAKRLFDHHAALYSCVSYAILSLSGSVLGVSAHATHFVVLFSLAGFILLLRAFERERAALLFFSGICFGLAFAMKQHAALFLISAVVYLVWRVVKTEGLDSKDRLAGISLFLFGAVIPYALIVLWVVKSGSFDDFWFWTVRYAREYTSTPPLEAGWGHFVNAFGNIAKLQLPLLLFAGVGFVALCRKGRCADRFFLSSFILFSLISISPGMIFREHYFVMLLPAVSILAGSGINSAELLFKTSKLARHASLVQYLLLIATLGYVVYQERDCFFSLSPQEVSRTMYGANPFPEASQIANFIKNNTQPDDRIAVLGSEPEIYFLSDRSSATGYIYTYEMMQNQPYAERMQSQLTREVEASRPSCIVFVNVPSSWALGESSFKSVLHWSDSYIANSYDLVGVIDIIDPKTTRYVWGNEAVKYLPVSEAFVSVFKRKHGI